MDFRERIKFDVRTLRGVDDSLLEQKLLNLKADYFGDRVEGISELVSDYYISKKEKVRQNSEGYWLGSDITEFYDFKFGDYISKSTIFSEISLGAGKYNFCLLYDIDLDSEFRNWKSLAGLSFNVEEDGFKIEQFQGVRFSKLEDKSYLNALTKLRWKELLLDYFLDWSKSCDVYNIKILGVKNNYWAQVTKGSLENSLGESLSWDDLIYITDDKMRNLIRAAKIKGMDEGDVHLWPKRGFNTYDQLALDSGFREDGFGDYILEL